MSYESFGEFAAGIKEAGAVEDASGKKNPSQKNDLKTYWEWYRAAKGQQEIILGRGQDIKSLVQKYGCAQCGGNILYNANTWDIYVNDCWILGGIHAHADFYLATVLDYNSVYNEEGIKSDDPTRILYVTTREIAALNLFGYSRTNESGPKGQKFTCTQPTLATNATFASYKQHVSAIAKAAR